MKKIIDYYNQFDEWGRLDREPLEFKVNWHYIRRFLPDSGHILDNGAGPGKYAIELANCGYDVTLTDLTPRLVEMARDKAVELRFTERFKGFYTANAMDLNRGLRLSSSMLLLCWVRCITCRSWTIEVGL